MHYNQENHGNRDISVGYKVSIRNIEGKQMSVKEETNNEEIKSYGRL